MEPVIGVAGFILGVGFLYLLRLGLHRWVWYRSQLMVAERLQNVR